MKQAYLDFFRENGFGPARWLAALLPVVLAAGCGGTPVIIKPPNPQPNSYYRPSNVAVESPFLPASVKRVALLPLTSAGAVPLLQQGVDALEPVVDSELKKIERFEVITVSPAMLQQLTGQAAWRADESLPMDFFHQLQRETGCDAVMFAEVTRYQPYQPLAVGWKFCLAAQGVGEKAEPRKLWSVDEVLDGGDARIARAAQTYYSQHLENAQNSGDPSTILRSPAMFGQFSLSALFATVPIRSAP